MKKEQFKELLLELKNIDVDKPAQLERMGQILDDLIKELCRDEKKPVRKRAIVVHDFFKMDAGEKKKVYKLLEEKYPDCLICDVKFFKKNKYSYKWGSVTVEPSLYGRILVIAKDFVIAEI